MNKKIRKIIEINEELCNGCGECLISCAEKAIEIVDGKARLVSDIYCDGLGNCLGSCKMGALKVVEKEAEDFDEDKTLKHVHQQNINNSLTKNLNSGNFATKCLSNAVRDLSKNQGLRNWPIKLRLIPVEANFLNRDNLLIAADCSGFASPNFYEKFLDAKTPLITVCPKFEDTNDNLEKLSSILTKHPDIQAIKVVLMSVLCCQKLMALVEDAIKISNRKEIVVKAEKIFI